jgi:hypothetical protein
MTTFQKAFAWTAVPLVALSLLSTAGTWQQGLYFVWAFALLAWLITLGAVIAFAIAGKQEVSSGVLAGFGVGFLALFVSCFVNLRGM